jgi:uncharacterized protein YqfA (UPF0365 family)
MKDKYKVDFGNFLSSMMSKTPYRKIKELVEVSEKHDLGAGYRDLETHILAGGDPKKVIRGLQFLKEKRISGEFEDVAVLDLALKGNTRVSLEEWLRGIHEEGITDLKKAPFPND